MADVGFIVANAAVPPTRTRFRMGAAFILRGKADGAPVDMCDLTKNDPAVLQRTGVKHLQQFHTRTNGDGTAITS